MGKLSMWRRFWYWVAAWWPHYDITKTVDGVEVLYLRRFFIFRSRWGSIYLHNIVRPDEDPDPHDHPWSFVSVILRGGYKERLFKMMTVYPYQAGWAYKRKWLDTVERSAPSIAFRSAETVHQIARVNPNTWTLVFAGRVKRDWGFVREDGWVFWRSYLDCWEPVDMD